VPYDQHRAVGVADDPRGDGAQEVVGEIGIVRRNHDHVAAGLVGEFEDFGCRAAFTRDQLGAA